MFINAEEMTAVLYLSKENEVAGELNQREDIAWIAEKVNCLNLIPAEFKISDEDTANASLVRFCNQEDDTVNNKNLFFFLLRPFLFCHKMRVPFYSIVTQQYTLLLLPKALRYGNKGEK